MERLVYKGQGNKLDRRGRTVHNQVHKEHTFYNRGHKGRKQEYRVRKVHKVRRVRKVHKVRKQENKVRTVSKVCKQEHRVCKDRDHKNKTHQLAK